MNAKQMSRKSLVSKKTLGVMLGFTGLGLATLGIAQPAQAFTIVQQGGAINGTGSAITPITTLPTNVTTAQTNFLNAANGLGTTTVEGFENTPQTHFYSNSTGPNPGTGTWTRGAGSNLSITVSSGSTTIFDPTNGIIAQSNTNLAYGFNTTIGGSQLLRIAPRAGTTQTSVTFNFATGVRAFGIFITDYGNSTNGSLRALVNGTNVGTPFARYINDGSSTYRSAQFFGVTQQAGDPLITSVRFQLSGVTSDDRFGFDNVYSTQAVPVPPQVLGSITLAGLTLLKKRKQQKAAPAMA
jgi:hypothetical protein